MTDVDRFISPYQYCENPTEEIGKILTAVGFQKFKIKIMDRVYEYRGIESLKRKFVSVFNILFILNQKHNFRSCFGCQSILRADAFKFAGRLYG